MFKWFQRSKTNPPEESSSPPPLEGQLEGQVPPTELAEGLENEAELLPEAEAKKDSAPTQSGGWRGLWEGARQLALTPVDPWFAKMAQGLEQTRRHLVDRVADLFHSSRHIDEEFWEELEDILLTADVGLAATTHILDELRRAQKEKKLTQPAQMLEELKSIVGQIFARNGSHAGGLKLDPQRLNVILMVGVNGVGKTTTTAKLAAQFQKEGYKVLLAAADTFRAAAIEQLEVWAKRLGVEFVRHQEGSDPSAVVFDALQAAQARGCNLVFIDTAGRLHNKANLMDELRKIKRVAHKAYPGAPQETLLVLDATTGQNALEQAKIFNQVTEMSGLVMCKLDGTGKGGVLVALGQELPIPVRYIGVGEGIDDLRQFEPAQFLEALFSAPANYKEFSDSQPSDPQE